MEKDEAEKKPLLATYDLLKCFTCGKSRNDKTTEQDSDKETECDNDIDYDSDEDHSCLHYCHECGENYDGNFFSNYSCVYCILDGKQWKYEWDSLREITRDILGVRRGGAIDALKYVEPYRPDKDRYVENMKEKETNQCDFRCENNAIRFAYEEGFYGYQ